MKNHKIFKKRKIDVFVGFLKDFLLGLEKYL